MSEEKPRRISSLLGIYGLWVVLAALGVLTAFQLHTTLVFVGLRIVEGGGVSWLIWNTSTIHGLSRFLYLAIGAVWLLMVMLLDGYLRAAHKRHRLGTQALNVALVLGALYGLCYLVLLLLA